MVKKANYSREKDIPTHVVAVFAVVQKENTFLIAKRSSSDPQAGGEWSVPGGKVDMETGWNIIEKTLKREVMEEVGLEIKDEMIYLGSDGFIRVSGHHVVSLIFLCKWKSGTAEPLEDQEEIKWMTIRELNKFKDLPIYVKNKFKCLEEYLLRQ